MTNQKLNRPRFTAHIAPETHVAIKQLKETTGARSEGAVLDDAIEHYQKYIQRKTK